MTAQALVVDDDAVTRLVLCHMLRQRGWVVEEAADVPAAAAAIGGATHDLVVSDFLLPSGTGLDVLAAAEDVTPRPVFVLVTGVVDGSPSLEPVRRRLGGHLTKPVSSEALDTTLRRLFPDSGTEVRVQGSEDRVVG